MRIDTDSTLDESVEMQMWVWDRSRFMRIARWRNTAVCALIAGVAVTVYIPEPWSVKIAFGGTTAAITGFVYYALYPWELRRRLRKVCRKLRGTVGPVPFTLELDAEGIHCQYKDTRNSSAWSKVEVIEDRGGTVIFWMRDYTVSPSCGSGPSPRLPSKKSSSRSLTAITAKPLGR